MIVDPYVHPLQAISLTFGKTDGVLTHVPEIPVIIEIPSPSRGRFSHVPLPLFLPKGGTSFRGHGSTSSSEPFSLLGTLLLGGDYLVSFFFSLGGMISFL